MVFDGAAVYTGSLNGSESSELKSFENLVTVKQPSVVRKYAERFELKRRYGGGQRDAVPASIEHQDGKGRCHFKPIALTGPQLAELRKLYRKDAC